MNKPRLALVTPLWPMQGAPHAGKPLVETALALKDWADLEVFCPAPNYPPVRLLEPRNFVYLRADQAAAPGGLITHYLEYWTLPGVGRRFNGLFTRRALAAPLARFRPELILGYWLYPSCWALLGIARDLGVPLIVGSRGSDLHRIPDKFTRHRTREVLERAAAVLTVTQDLRRLAIDLGARPEHTHSIPNGCDVTVYRPLDRLESRQRLNLPAGGRLLVQVGQILSSKGVFDLYEAFRRLAAGDPELRLAVVGDGPAANELRRQAAQDNLAGRVLMPGSRPAAEIALWMAAADAVCLASHGEGCPNVIIEALACDRPVVGTTVGGIPELVTQECGELAPPHQPEAFAAAITRLFARSWEDGAITARATRSWREVAAETWEVCKAVQR
ncbi:MAG: glycosyltransferase [Bryobacterales bacterium]|nr:glycosyltransferase [Bryobacterales bacterium]